eukprot:COSAG02_NODE_23097_length_730_cov_1.099842_2_plen_54_part_01
MQLHVPRPAPGPRSDSRPDSDTSLYLSINTGWIEGERIAFNARFHSEQTFKILC